MADLRLDITLEFSEQPQAGCFLSPYDSYAWPRYWHHSEDMFLYSTLFRLYTVLGPLKSSQTNIRMIQRNRYVPVLVPAW